MAAKNCLRMSWPKQGNNKPMQEEQQYGNLAVTANVKSFIAALPTRTSMRGLKRCPACGTLNGQRSKVCRNATCELRQKLLPSRRPFDPVQLVCRNAGHALYSLRCREHSAQPRNFVELEDGSVLCYSCTSEADMCSHIRTCAVDCAPVETAPFPQAEVYAVAREVLWNLIGITSEHKQRLWELCQENDSVPAVQRISPTLFVVRCEPSTTFPAGRLHVTAVSNGLSTKKGTHSCACKKLKIIVDTDNSVVMQEEVCDHILLVLAAVLSKKHAKAAYGNFTNALKAYWMPAALENPIVDFTQEDALFGLSIDIGGNFDDGEHASDTHADNIFIYNSEFLDDNHIPDFADMERDPIISSNQIVAIGKTSDSFSPFASGMQFNEEIRAADATQLELSDCNIELMDQFQLTHQIDLCDDDIMLTEQFFDSLSHVSTQQLPVAQQPCQSSGLSIGAPQSKGISLLKANQLPESVVPEGMTPLPPIEMPTIAVVKKCPIKAADIITEVKTRKFPHLPAKRALIINTTTPDAPHGHVQTKEEVTKLPEEPSLAYSAWLDYVIEIINESIQIGETKDVVHEFHVHEEIFAHFSKRFSAGIKWRLPNNATVVKSGKHKGLIKYRWYFPTASTVRRIFSTQNANLQTERIFEKDVDGSFVPYINRSPSENLKHKRIYPKLALHTAFIWFECGNNEHKTGLKLEWLPNAFPKSHFGILTIEFSLGVRSPPMLGDKIN